MNTLSSLLLFIGQKLTSLQNQVYPIGSIYITTGAANPADLFGGQWRKIEGRFLLASSQAYTPGSTGGSANAIVPYHRHSVPAVSIAASGSHRHKQNDHWSSGDGGSTGAYTHQSKRKTLERYTDYSSHTHTVPSHNTDYAGTSGNATGANMPPYLVVNVWERTQ